MKIRNLIVLLAVIALGTVSASAFVDFSAGYTKTMGELGDRYSGGMYFGLELAIPLPGPFSIVPNASYASLGTDAMFTEIFTEYVEQMMPGGQLPPGFEDMGEIKSTMYTVGAGVRVKFVDNFIFGMSVEPGFMYVRRDLDAQGIPLSEIARYVEGFDMPVEPDNGYGFYVDLGGHILNNFPIITIDVGTRFIMAPNMGTTSYDEFLAENMPGYDAPTAKHLMMFVFYGGIGLF